MKTIILITAVVLCNIGISLAQNPVSAPTQYSSRNIPAINPGGEQGLQQFFKGFMYSEDMIKNKVKGDVILSMDVNIDGTLGNFQVDQDLGFGTAQEAVRLMGTSPKWVPAIENGLKAKSRITLNIPVDATANPNSMGQGTAQIVSQSSAVRSVKLDTNQVIYDEQGTALHYYQYHKLLISGEYSLRTDGDPSLPTTKRYLRKLSPGGQPTRMEVMKSMMAINSPTLQEGKELNLSPLGGSLKKNHIAQKVIVLIFWKSDCPPCTESFSTFNNFLKDLSPQDAMVIAVTPDGKKTAETALEKKPLLYAQLANNGQNIADEYGISRYPSFVIADKNRIIKLAINGMGPQTIPLIQSTLQALLQP